MEILPSTYSVASNPGAHVPLSGLLGQGEMFSFHYFHCNFHTKNIVSLVTLPNVIQGLYILECWLWRLDKDGEFFLDLSTIRLLKGLASNCCAPFWKFKATLKVLAFF